MRMRTAHHPRVGLAGLVQVIGIAAFAAQEHRVFGAIDRLADAVAAGRRLIRVGHPRIIAAGIARLAAVSNVGRRTDAGPAG
jgi:hypothetical protein